ncbi:hypothetical protein V8G54_020392 [Vigna mungo]|uniref:Uncharacterized protein n=1 Tax=Vigna mungo TaxID=3915 RepID=A0AAQ3NCF6_VIGMU
MPDEAFGWNLKAYGHDDDDDDEEEESEVLKGRTTQSGIGERESAKRTRIFHRPWDPRLLNTLTASILHTHLLILLQHPHGLDTSHPPSNPPSTPSRPKPGENLETNQETGFTGSSISEYLINTIPGMKFEDFLRPNLNGDEMLSVFSEGNMVSFSFGGIWVPQAAPSSGAYIGNRWVSRMGTEREGKQSFEEIQVSLVEIRVRVASEWPSSKDRIKSGLSPLTIRNELSMIPLRFFSQF